MIPIKSFQIVLLLLALIATSCKTVELTPRQTMVLPEERTDLSSFASTLTYTPELTYTSYPTRTPMPTISKTPGVLDCSAIVKAHSESTLVDWEGTKMLLRGSEIYYEGSVFAVTEHDEVHLTGSLCHATLHHVPHEIAIELSIGQYMEGYGTIASIGFNRGEDVDIEVYPDLLFVR
jgi:hypothetical protein